MQGWLRNTCVNAHLVKNGLAEISVDDVLLQDSFYNAKIQQFTALEKKAQKRGVGMWKRPPVVQRAKEFSASKIDSVSSRAKSKLRKIFGRGT